MNAPIIAEVTAATGDPIPIANPALAADDRDPRAAEVRPAPSRASPGQAEQGDDIARACGSSSGTLEVNGGVTTAAIATRLPKIAAAATAPRRAAYMPASL